MVPAPEKPGGITVAAGAAEDPACEEDKRSISARACLSPIMFDDEGERKPSKFVVILSQPLFI